MAAYLAAGEVPVERIRRGLGADNLDSLAVHELGEPRRATFTLVADVD